MSFLVYQCSDDPSVFVVTDPDHATSLGAEACEGRGVLKPIGEFGELGEARVAFNEAAARKAIARQGYYRFEAASFAPVPRVPEMPV